MKSGKKAEVFQDVLENGWIEIQEPIKKVTLRK